MTPKGVRASAAILLLAALLLLPAPAAAQGVGFFIRPDCTTLTSPVARTTGCLDSTGGVWRVYGGAAWATMTWINVVAYGADPTGSADSTTAIQAAINAIGGTEFGGGGVVFFPRGVYKTTATITRGAGEHNLRLVGEGPDASTIRPTSALGANPALSFGGTSNTLQFVAVENLGIDLQHIDSQGISVLNTRNFLASRLQISGLGGAAATSIGILVDQGAPVTFTGFTRIVDCYIQRLKRGIVLQNTTTASVIRDNTLVGGGGITTSQGIRIVAGNASGMLIEGNEIESWSDVGIWTSGAYQALVGNRFESNTNADIQFAGAIGTNVRSFTMANLYASAPALGNVVTPSSPNAAAEGIRILDNTTQFDAPNLDLAVRNITGTWTGTAITWGSLSNSGTLQATTTTLIASSTTTNLGYLQFQNGTGQARFGIEQTGGGGIFAGSGSFSTILGSNTNHPLNLAANGTVWVTLGTTGGLQAGTPTSGDKGAGTVNASAYYVHGTAIASMPLTNASGTLTNAPHLVQDTVTLTGGTAGVALAGAAAFTNATSYTCVCANDSSVLACRVAQNGGNGFTLSSGVGTDTVRFLCAGN